MHIIQFQDKFHAFVSKLQNWHRKVNLGKKTIFEELNRVVVESYDKLDNNVKKNYWEQWFT